MRVLLEGHALVFVLEMAEVPQDFLETRLFAEDL